MVDAYRSVILVDVPDCRVVENSLNRFNFSSDSGLESEANGSLRILRASEHNSTVPASNRLPAPAASGFSLTLRVHVPKDVVKRGERFPPALERLELLMPAKTWR